MAEIIFWGFTASTVYPVASLAEGVRWARQAGGVCFVRTPLMEVEVVHGVLQRRRPRI